MRIGLIGPAGDADALLSAAIRLLVLEFGVDQVVYLGSDGAIDRLAAAFTQRIGGSFDDRVLVLAQSGDAAELRDLLAAEAELARLGTLRVLPPAPSRTLEMIDDRFLLFVHDKATLEEDDIANAQVIVYAQSPRCLYRRFGPRAFFTPGMLSEGQVGMLETDVDGRLTITAHTMDGSCVLSEMLVGRSPKLSVSA